MKHFLGDKEMVRRTKKKNYSSLAQKRREEKKERLKREFYIFVALIIVFGFIYFFTLIVSDTPNTINKAVTSNVYAEEETESKDMDFEKMTEEQKNIQLESQKKISEKIAQQVTRQQEEERIKKLNKKTAYLTFDDGPSQNTNQILDTLKKYNIKSTFFVLGNMAEKSKNTIIRERDEGHLIANHTYSHDYNYLYASTDNFLKDFRKNEEVLKGILGSYSSNIVRFPGGSYGRKPEFKDALTKNGYKYYDWNCSTGDASAVYVNKDTIISNVRSSFANQKQLIILMHDAPAKTTTAEALPSIIEFLKSQGYEFDVLN